MCIRDRNSTLEHAPVPCSHPQHIYTTRGYGQRAPCSHDAPESISGCKLLGGARGRGGTPRWPHEASAGQQ
eukprot:4262119-Pyramimonas_sp.AAC.1